MENRKKLFRQESLKRLSSPDDLNDILRVVNPSSWAILLAVLLILAGMFVWTLVGGIEKKINASVEVSGGVARFAVKDTVLKSKMPVKVGDMESLMLNVGKDKDGNYIGTANVPGMTDGTYEAEITVERISPMKFLFN